MKVNSINTYKSANGQKNIKKANTFPQQSCPSSTPEFTGLPSKSTLGVLGALAAAALGLSGCIAPPVKPSASQQVAATEVTKDGISYWPPIGHGPMPGPIRHRPIVPWHPIVNDILASKLETAWKGAGMEITDIPKQIHYDDYTLDYATDKTLTANTADEITYTVKTTDNATGDVFPASFETYTLDKNTGELKLTLNNEDGTVSAEYLLKSEDGYLKYIDPATEENEGNFRKIKDGVVGVFNNDSGAIEDEYTNYTVDNKLASLEPSGKGLRDVILGDSKSAGSHDRHPAFHLPAKGDIVVMAKNLAADTAKKGVKSIA